MTKHNGETVSYRDCIIAWNPLDVIASREPCAIRVGRLLRDGDPDWTAPYLMTDGGVWREVRDMPRDAMIAHMFIRFHTCVVRDGIDPAAAHDEFLKIEEYRDVISPDCPV